MNSRTLLCSALSLLLVTACGDETPAEGNPPGVDASVTRPDATVLPDLDGGVILDDAGNPIPDAGSTDSGVTQPDAGGEPDAGQPGPRTLTFNGTSPQTIYYGQAQTLAFTVTSSGSPVSGASVQFTMQGSGGTLGAASATTNGQGVAQVVFTAGSADAQLTLIASSDRASPVALDLLVRVNPLGNATVNVTLSPQNRIPVTRAEIALVATPSTGVAPTCAALLTDPLMPSTPNLATLQPVPGSKQFTSLATGSTLVALVRGLNANGLPVAAGCAEGAHVVGGGSVAMSVVLTQLPPVLEGDMSALLNINLGSALPQPYEGYLNLVGAIVGNPAGVASYYVLQRVDALNLPLIPKFLNITVNGTTRQATLDEVLASSAGSFDTWRLLSQFVDTQITNTSFGPTYTKIKVVGNDLNTMVRAFDVGARMHIAKLPTAGQLQINEKWEAIVYTWGYNCPAGDVGCARHAMIMDNTNYAPLNETYAATYSRVPSATQTERYQLDLDPHNIPLRYGAIVLLALEELVVPRVTECDTCHSVTDLLAYAVNCNSVGTAVSNWIGNLPLVGTVLGAVVTPDMVGLACTMGLSTAGSYVEDKALALTANNVQLGTAPGVNSGGTFYLVDADKDLKTELLQELSIDMQWFDPNDPNVAQDINAPLVGAGRAAATDCSSDLECLATESCQVIPSYLQIQAVETTCKAAVGTLDENAACTSNAQCRSGLCAAGQCFAACTENAECSSNSCIVDRASVDLNGVRQGLGLAAAQGCAP